jgi:hypothetical protein
MQRPLQHPALQADHHCKVVFAGQEGRIVLSRFPFLLVQTSANGIIHHRYWIDLSGLDFNGYAERAVELDQENEEARKSA